VRGIPGVAVVRLAAYRRELADLLRREEATVSSSELASRLGVNAATVRRDLSRLGSYGLRGTGYDVAHLLARVDAALALDRDWPVAIVGVGNLGRALAGSRGFTSDGFRVVALVDVDPRVVGSRVGTTLVEHLVDLPAIVAREHVAIGIVATPASAAQHVVWRLAEAGVRSILNFAPAHLEVPEGVAVRHVDLAVELQVLAYFGAHGEARRLDRSRPRPAAAAGPR
jgi:redox-sensing transcriptional repressor